MDSLGLVIEGVADPLSVTAVVRRFEFPVSRVDPANGGVVGVDPLAPDRVSFVALEPAQGQGLAVDQETVGDRPGFGLAHPVCD